MVRRRHWIVDQQALQQMTPMHLNIIELAESLGVEESEVESWVRHDGLPHVTDRNRLLFAENTGQKAGGA